MPTVAQATARTNQRVAAKKSGASKEQVRAITSADFDADGGARTDFTAYNEPSVLSSTSGKNNFLTEEMPTINGATEAFTLAEKKREENASADTKAKEKASEIPLDVQEELDAGTDEVAKAQQALRDSWDEQAKEAKRLAEELTLSAREEGRAAISNLTGQWKQRRQLLEESNRRSQSSWKQQFIRFGQDEYSPGMTGQFMSEKEQEGLNILADLDERYNSAVAEIRAATNAKKYSTAANLASTLRELEEKALNQMLENAKEAKAVNDKLKESSMLASRENSIASLITQYGITDPAELQQFLNYDDAGKLIGDISLEEVSKVLKIMGHDPSMAGLSADYKTYRQLKNDGEIGESWSYTDYLSAISNAKRTGSGGGGGSTGGGIASFDQFVEGFLQTPEGKQMVAEVEAERKQNFTPEGIRAELQPQLKELYEQAANEVIESGSDYDKARALIQTAEDKNWNVLRSAILERTKLSATEIDTLLKAEGLSPTTSTGADDFSDEDFKAWLEGD